VKRKVGANFRAGPVSQIVSSVVRIAGVRSGFATAAITVGVMGILGAHPTFAAAPSGADETSPDNQLQEVVVIAQFRQQSAQTTPIAITAVTGQQLDERSIASVTDLNGVAPNVNITAGTATNGPVAQIFIRGVSARATATRASSPASASMWMTSIMGSCWVRRWTSPTLIG
jgi:outer membrane receptor protein involved in Fe transport